MSLKCSIIKFARVQSEEEFNAGAPEAPKKLCNFHQEFPSGGVHSGMVMNPAAPQYLAAESDKDSNIADEDR